MGKKQTLIYLIILIWVFFGIFSVYKEVSFQSMSAYFGSLTAYIATYIWGESKRPSSNNPRTSILFGGPFSHRELLIYILILIWFFSGIIIVYLNLNLVNLAIYFSSLTGFIGSWIAGEVYSPESNRFNKEQLNQQNNKDDKSKQNLING